MNITLVGLIALVTFAWTLFLKQIDGSGSVSEVTQLSDVRPIKNEQKTLGATFRQDEYVGYWYEKEGRLEIFRSNQLVNTMYLVDGGRAEFHFQRWVRNDQ